MMFDDGAKISVNMRTCEYVNMRTCEYTSMRTCGHENMRVCEHANMQGRLVKSGWRPFCVEDNFLEWRRRRFTKTADHIAGEAMKHRKSFSHRNQALIDAIKFGNANILMFSDGGACPEREIGAAGWVAHVLVGHCGSDTQDVHLLAAEGIFLNRPTTAFLAEMTAADSAIKFVCGSL